MSDILKLLVDGEFITDATRRMVAAFATRWRVSPFHALIETAVLGESELADHLASLLGIDRLYSLKGLAIAPEAANIIGFQRAREWECIALTADSGTAAPLDVVLADPTAEARIETLRRELNCGLTLACAERSDIVRAIDELYPLSAQLPSLFHEKGKKSSAP